MATFEEVFYDFTSCELNVMLNKKILGERTPIPLKITIVEDNEYSYISSFEETKEEIYDLENSQITTTLETEVKKNKNISNNKEVFFLNILKKKYFINYLNAFIFFLLQTKSSVLTK